MVLGGIFIIDGREERYSSYCGGYINLTITGEQTFSYSLSPIPEGHSFVRFEFTTTKGTVSPTSSTSLAGSVTCSEKYADITVKCYCHALPISQVVVCDPIAGGTATVSPQTVVISNLAEEYTFVLDARSNSGYKISKVEIEDGSRIHTYSAFSDRSHVSITQYAEKYKPTFEHKVYFVESSDCVVSTVNDPEEGGTSSGGGTYRVGDTCTVSATPNSGYTFVRWSDGGARTHSFTVSSDVTLTAVFAKAALVTLIADPSDAGTVSGGGYYALGSTCTVSATPKDGTNFFSEFLRWSDGGAQTHSFTVTQDVTLTATFRKYRMVAVRDSWDQKYSNCRFWTSTVQCGSASATTSKMADAVIKVYDNSTIYISTQISGLPAWVRNTFNGYYRNDEPKEGGTLITKELTYSFNNPTQRITNIYVNFTMEMMFKLDIVRSLKYRGGTYETLQDGSMLKPILTAEPEDESFSFSEPEYKTDHWEVWMTFTGSDYYTKTLIEIPVKSNAFNDVVYGPIDFESDDFVRTSTTTAEKGGLQSWNHGSYTKGAIFTPHKGRFRISFTTSNPTEPGVIRCVYSGAPYMTFILKGRDSEGIEDMALGNGRYTRAEIDLHPYNDSNLHKIGMTSQCEYQSDMKSYKLKIPISALKIEDYYAFQCDMYPLMTPAWSLYIKKIVGSEVTVLVADNADYGRGKSVEEYPDSDFTILMFLGNYLPLISTSNGKILINNSGTILNDS